MLLIWFKSLLKTQKTKNKTTKNYLIVLWAGFVKRINLAWFKMHIWNAPLRGQTALERRTILCQYVPGFQRQNFKHIPKCKCIPLKKFLWIPRTNTCNVKFIGTLVFPQQANKASCSGFCNWKWIHIWSLYPSKHSLGSLFPKHNTE